VPEPMRVLVSCRLMWDSLPEFEETFARAGVELLIPDVSGQQLGEAELLPLVSDIDGIIAGDDHITRRVLEAAPKLKVVAKWGVGTDSIDVTAAEEHGVAVRNTPGMFGDEQADYALGFILLLARRQHEVDRSVRAGEWAKPRGISLAGKQLGIVGLGSSGRALARRATALGLQVCGSDPAPPDAAWASENHVDIVDFDQLIARSDIVSLHLPVTPETDGLIDGGVLRRMKRGAWLVNVSRGRLVVEADLVAALTSGTIGAAALDVFEHEPVPMDSPLLSMPNVVVGSHNASNTREAVDRANRATVENLLVELGVEP